MGQKRSDIGIALFQITVAKVRMDRPVANRMDGFSRLAAPAFGHRMMPFGNVTHFTPAKPASDGWFG